MFWSQSSGAITLQPQILTGKIMTVSKKTNKAKDGKAVEGKVDDAIYTINQEAFEAVGKLPMVPTHIKGEVIKGLRDKTEIRRVQVTSDNNDDKEAKIKIKVVATWEEGVTAKEVENEIENARANLKAEMIKRKAEGITPKDDSLLLYVQAYLHNQLKDRNSKISKYAESLKISDAGDKNPFSPYIEIKVDDILRALYPDRPERAKNVEQILNSFFVLSYPKVDTRIYNAAIERYEIKNLPLIQYYYKKVLNKDAMTVDYDAIDVSFNAIFVDRPDKGGYFLNSLSWIPKNSEYNSVLRATLYRMIIRDRGYHTQADKIKNKAAKKEGIEYNGASLKIRYTVGDILKEMGDSKRIYFTERRDTKDLTMIEDSYLTDAEIKRKNSDSYQSPKEYRKRISPDFRRSIFESDLIRSLDDMKAKGAIAKYILPKPKDDPKKKNKFLIGWKKPYTDTAIYVTVRGEGWITEERNKYDNIQEERNNYDNIQEAEIEEGAKMDPIPGADEANNS